MNDEGLNHKQRLVLMAARIHNLRPGIQFTSNCGRVIWTALEWAGLLSPDVQAAWEDDFAYNPLVREWQGVLIGLIQDRSSDEPLLEGVGLFGTPDEPRALPWFTGCRLTPKGEQIAEELLKQNPQYKIADSKNSP